MELTIPQAQLNMAKAAQLRLHKQKVLAIEGDDEAIDMASTGPRQVLGTTERGTYSL
jgi:hypothetical protein